MAKDPPRPIFPDLPCTVKDYFERQAWLHVVWCHAGLSGGQKVVGDALADHLSMESGQLNPALPTLAAETAQSPRAAKKAIDALEGAGLLVKQSGSGRTSTSYTLLIPAVETGTSVPPRLEQTYQAARNVCARRLEQARRRGGTPVPPNLVINLEETSAGARPRGPTGASGPAITFKAKSWGEIGDRLKEAMEHDAFEVWFGGGKAKIEALADGTWLITFFNPANARMFPARFEAVLDSVLTRWEIAGRARSSAVAA